MSLTPTTNWDFSASLYLTNVLMGLADSIDYFGETPLEISEKTVFLLQALLAQEGIPSIPKMVVEPVSKKNVAMVLDACGSFWSWQGVDGVNVIAYQQGFSPDEAALVSASPSVFEGFEVLESMFLLKDVDLSDIAFLTTSNEASQNLPIDAHAIELKPIYGLSEMIERVDHDVFVLENWDSLGDGYPVAKDYPFKNIENTQVPVTFKDKTPQDFPEFPSTADFMEYIEHRIKEVKEFKDANWDCEGEARFAFLDRKMGVYKKLAIPVETEKEQKDLIQVLSFNLFSENACMPGWGAAIGLERFFVDAVIDGNSKKQMSFLVGQNLESMKYLKVSENFCVHVEKLFNEVRIKNSLIESKAIVSAPTPRF